MSKDRILLKVLNWAYNILQHPEPCSSNLNEAVREIIGKCLEQISARRPSFRELKGILSDTTIKQDILAADVRSITDRVQGPNVCDILSGARPEYSEPRMIHRQGDQFPSSNNVVANLDYVSPLQCFAFQIEYI